MKSLSALCFLLISFALSVSAVAQGLVSFKDEKGKWGYKNAEGSIVIPAKYDVAAREFAEGLAAVIINDKCGVINTQGMEVIPMKYEFIQPFSEGVAGARLKGSWGVIDTKGNEILPFKYSYVVAAKDGAIGVQYKSKEWLKFTLDGQPYRGQWKLEKQNLKKGGSYRMFYGFKYENGEYAIEPIYNFLDTLSENVLRIGIGDNKYKAKYGLLDRNTLKIILPVEYEMPTNVISDLRGIKQDGRLLPIGKNDKYGFIDSTGVIVVPLKYDYTAKFSNGLAMVRTNGKSGFIDESGKEVIPLQYSSVSDFYKGYAIVRQETKFGVINTMGDLVAPLQFDYIASTFNDIMAFNVGGKIEGKYGTFNNEGKWGFMEYNGKEILPARYDEIGDRYYPFSTGTTGVKIDGNWRVIDQKGNMLKASLMPEKVLTKVGYKYPGGGMVIKEQFDAGFSFSDGYAVVGMENRKGGMLYGYIDTLGNKITDIRYEQALSFSEELGAVAIGGKWGFVDRKGKEVTGLKYDNAGQLRNGLAPVAVGKKSGYIDKTGKEVIPVKYDEAYAFAEDRALIKLGNKFAFLDPSGKEIIPLQLGNAGSFSHGLAWINHDGKFGFIDKTGKVVIPLLYDYAESFSEGVAVVRNGIAAGETNLSVDRIAKIRAFYIDTKGNKAIDAEYPEAYSFQGGRASVYVSRDNTGYLNASTFIDHTGKQLEPIRRFVRPLTCEEKTNAMPYQVGDVVAYLTSTDLFVITDYSCSNDSYGVRTNGYSKGYYDGVEGRFYAGFFKKAEYHKVNAITCPVCSGKGQWLENKTTTKTDVDNYNAMAPGAKVITTNTYNRTETVICGQCKGLGLIRQ